MQPCSLVARPRTSAEVDTLLLLSVCACCHGTCSRVATASRRTSRRTPSSSARLRGLWCVYCFTSWFSLLTFLLLSFTTPLHIVIPIESLLVLQVTEYYLIRCGHYHLADLYSNHKDGWYYYTYGVNFRAYAAYIAGILINVVGFAGASECWSYLPQFLFFSSSLRRFTLSSILFSSHR